MLKRYKIWVQLLREALRTILVEKIDFLLCFICFSFLLVSELSIGMQTEGIDITSVGNTNTLQESTLVEAFNLRAAIEFILKNC